VWSQFTGFAPIIACVGEALDENIGQVLDYLDASGLAENAIVS
jgi:arylsulfatase A-like enzyme